eukprot:gene21907-28362_t
MIDDKDNYKDKYSNKKDSYIDKYADSYIDIDYVYNYDEETTDNDEIEEDHPLNSKPIDGTYYLKDILDIAPILESFIDEVDSKVDSKVYSCRICGDDFIESTGLALGCNHWFCLTCYSEYVKSQINDGPSCITMKCPEFKCTQVVSRLVISSITEPAIYSKYRMYVTRNYIDTSRNMKYCPAADCTKVAIGSGVTKIRCTCNNPFCFRCGEEAHDPVNCQQLGVWFSKCQDESETANWILANTKKCPKCLTRIEKNQGCNHMTCKICRFEFCWICEGDWKEHGQSSGGFYKCNKYDSTKPTGSSEAEKAKAELDRYLHFYQRYHAHNVSLRFANQQRSIAERKMLEQQESSKTAWIDLQFVKQAVELVIDCRRVLKYTYVLGYSFDVSSDGPVASQKRLFEYQQEMLEKNTDKLQEFIEQPLDNMDKVQIINLTRVTEKFLESLLHSVANELTEDDSFIVADSKNNEVTKKGKDKKEKEKEVSKAVKSPRVTRSASKNNSSSK